MNQCTFKVYRLIDPAIYSDSVVWSEAYCGETPLPGTDRCQRHQGER